MGLFEITERDLFDDETLARLERQEKEFNKKTSSFNLSYLGVLPLAVIAYLVLKK